MDEPVGEGAGSVPDVVIGTLEAVGATVIAVGVDVFSEITNEVELVEALEFDITTDMVLDKVMTVVATLAPVETLVTIEDVEDAEDEEDAEEMLSDDIGVGSMVIVVVVVV